MSKATAPTKAPLQARAMTNLRTLNRAEPVNGTGTQDLPLALEREERRGNGLPALAHTRVLRDETAIPKDFGIGSAWTCRVPPPG